MSTGGPVSRNELLAILEAVLEVNRATLISDGNVYRVVPDSEKKAHAVSVFDYAKERSETGPGYGVTVLPLEIRVVGDDDANAGIHDDQSGRPCGRPSTTIC